MLKSSLTAIILMAVTIPALAQVDVVDSEPVNSSNTSGYSASPVAEPKTLRASAPDSYAQIQAMQEEIQELRGLVEQQSNELKRLKQQREDDYIDLDRRLGAMSKGGASTSKASEDPSDAEMAEKKTLKKDPPSPKSPAPSTEHNSQSGSSSGNDEPIATSSAANSASTADEYSSYSGALNLIVKTKEYDQGIASMAKYLAHYPKGKYAPNAYFWMASAYQTQNKPDKSIETFEKMVKRYPKEPKSDEARVRLARVYLQRGDKEEAKIMLEEVVEAAGPQSKSAQDMLQRSF